MSEKSQKLAALIERAQILYPQWTFEADPLEDSPFVDEIYVTGSLSDFISWDSPHTSMRELEEAILWEEIASSVSDWARIEISR